DLPRRALAPRQPVEAGAEKGCEPLCLLGRSSAHPGRLAGERLDLHLEAAFLRSCRPHPISALPSEYSLWERNLEPRIIPILRELGIGLVPFAPLGRGFLTGAVQRAETFPEGDFRRNDPRLQGANFEANVRVASTVQDMAKRKGATPGQVALAWLLSR